MYGIRDDIETIYARVELIPISSDGLYFLSRLPVTIYDCVIEFEEEELEDAIVDFYNYHYTLKNHSVICTKKKITLVKIPYNFEDNYNIVQSEHDEIKQEPKCKHDIVDDTLYGEKICTICAVINPIPNFVNREYFDKRYQINEDYTIYDPNKRFCELLYGYIYGKNYHTLHDYELEVLERFVHEFKGRLTPPLDWQQIYTYFSNLGTKSNKYGGICNFSHLWLYVPYHLGIRLEEDHVDVCYYFIKINERRKGNRMNNLYVIWKSFQYCKKDNYVWIPMKLSQKTIKENNYKWEDVFGYE